MNELMQLLNAKKELYEIVKESYENSNVMKINEREYSLIENITHSQRVEIYQYHSECQNGTRTLKYTEVEAMLNKICLCEGQLLSGAKDHFNKYPEDYDEYIINMLELSVYPFLQGKITNFLNMLEESQGSL